MEHLYIVTYDVSDPKRWRRIYRLMKGYGQWLQLSVFQCRLSPRRRMELMASLKAIIHHDQDHVLVIDLGGADRVSLQIVSLGQTYAALERVPVIV